MHILIKKKILVYNNYKVKCSIGKRGIGVKKREGDLITPKGSFKIKEILYRADKIKNLKSKLQKKIINKKMGWCDDPRSNKYNKLIKLPFKFGYEKLYRTENIYDLILVLNFNMNPVKKNKGSAIFIHVAKKNFTPTKGCVAIVKTELKKLSTLVTKKTIVNII